MSNGENTTRVHKRLKRFEVPQQARFITCSCWQRMALLQNPAIRNELAAQIALVRSRDAFRLLGWVIMPEHFHMLIIPTLPIWNVPRILRAIKGPFAQRILARWRDLNAPVLPRLTDWSGKSRFWQRGGGYDRNVVSDSERIEKLEYMHNNPMQRGLVTCQNDWAWSSARSYTGCGDVLIPIDLVQ